MAKSYEEFLHDAHKVCDDLAPYLGEGTGVVYGTAAELLTESPAVGAGVEQVIGGFVGDHWGDVCDLPANLQNLISSDRVEPTVGNSPADSTPDNSISPAD